jgi:hypothetical protein
MSATAAADSAAATATAAADSAAATATAATNTSAAASTAAAATAATNTGAVARTAAAAGAGTCATARAGAAAAAGALNYGMVNSGAAAGALNYGMVNSGAAAAAGGTPSAAAGGAPSAAADAPAESAPAFSVGVVFWVLPRIYAAYAEYVWNEASNRTGVMVSLGFIKREGEACIGLKFHPSKNDYASDGTLSTKWYRLISALRSALDALDSNDVCFKLDVDDACADYRRGVSP